MTTINLGIIGGGQLGSMLASAAKKLGIKSNIKAYPSICLGTFDLSVFEMVSAYSTFSNKGIWIEPIYISRIED